MTYHLDVVEKIYTKILTYLPDSLYDEVEEMDFEVVTNYSWSVA